MVDLGKGVRADVALFNEAQSRVIISTSANNASAVLALLEWRGVPAKRIGTVEGDELKITSNGVETHWPVSTLHEAWYHSIERAMAGEEHVLVAAAE